MKYKTTKKAVNNGYAKVICLSYCSLETALTYFAPVAYCTRAEGWSCDIYEFDNIAISTGYAPFGNIKPSYDTVKKYEKKAAQIEQKRYKEYMNKKKAMYRLIIDFINELTGYNLSRNAY